MNLAPPTRRANPPERSTADPLAEAFARHQGELLGTLFYLVGNLADAQDALQEAFLKCWRRKDDVPAIGNLRAWIFKVALNTGRDMRGAAWRTRRQAVASGELAAWEAAQPAPDETAAAHEEQHLLRVAIEQLRPEEQEVFLLRQNGDLTYEEIGETLGIPVGTAKTRMRLALEKLRLSLPVIKS